jgi:hypothetical protein
MSSASWSKTFESENSSNIFIFVSIVFLYKRALQSQ